MCVTKPGDAAGQGYVAACCGTGDMCNLRIIHDGIDIAGVMVGIPPQKVRDLWILKSPRGHIVITSTKDTIHTFLIANDGSTATAVVDPPKVFSRSRRAFHSWKTKTKKGIEGIKFME